MATPPPFLCILASFIKIKAGGADSIKTVSLNHVSVKKIKSRLCLIIKSLIKNDLPTSDLMFNNAILVLKA